MLRQFIVHEKQLAVMDEFLEGKPLTAKELCERTNTEKDDMDKILKALLYLNMIEKHHNQYIVNFYSEINKCIDELGLALCNFCLNRGFSSGNLDNVSVLYHDTDSDEIDEDPFSDEMLLDILKMMSEMKNNI